MGLCLVTGGAGFIGCWVVAKLLQRGKRVIVLDNLTGGSRHNLAEFRGHSGYEGLIRGDIRRSWTHYEIFFRGLEAVFHLAARVDVRASVEDPVETFECDVKGTMQLLDKCREYDTKMVFMSTCHVYGNNDQPIDEGFIVKPSSPYAACKLAAENLCMGYHHAYGLPIVILRPFNTYGPYQCHSGEGGVVARFTRRALNGEPLVLHGGGEQTRDFMYVEDCAVFVVKAGFSTDCEGQVLNAATGSDGSIRELATTIAGEDTGFVIREHPHSLSESARMVGDSSKAKDLLQWEPAVNLEEGLCRTRQWVERKAKN